MKGHMLMKIACLVRSDADAPLTVLAEFLKKPIAAMKYGKTVIYEGETYYIPYACLTYQIQETGEQYVFLDSRLSEDVSVFRQTDASPIREQEQEAGACRMLDGRKEDEIIRQEIQKKILMNRKMRKLFKKFHFEETQLRTVYLPEQTFYVKGKENYLFLVDNLLGKVDYKHLKDVEMLFADNYLKKLKS